MADEPLDMDKFLVSKEGRILCIQRSGVDLSLPPKLLNNELWSKHQSRMEALFPAEYPTMTWELKTTKGRVSGKGPAPDAIKRMQHGYDYVEGRRAFKHRMNRATKAAEDDAKDRSYIFIKRYIAEIRQG